MKAAVSIARYRIGRPEKFRLREFDPDNTGSIDIGKRDAKDLLAKDVERLSKLQEQLYAQDRFALLVILQGMDAAGKDSVIEHVMSGVNPQGCAVHSFKAPSSTELDHDFMWRTTLALPERGMIGIFNRSYYEEVVAVRVHPEILARQKLPAPLVTRRIWQQRFEDIRAFERYLARNGTVILKFFLHISKEEQRRRLLDRLEEPAKRWKFSVDDIEKRKLWPRYMHAYQDAIRHTSTREAPWHVVPADRKWFTRLVVAGTIVDALKRLNLEFPKVDGKALAELNKVRRTLIAEGPALSKKNS